MQWTDVFSEVSRRKVGKCANKTLPADEITWRGLFRGHAVSVVSTVRLVMGNLAHFTVNSGARIGAHSWDLPGGYYVDLAVESVDGLTDEDLLSIGQLAAAVEARPVWVRRRGERLAEARHVEAGIKGDQPSPTH